MFQMAMRIACSTATMALTGPRREAMRRYFADRQVPLLRAAGIAAMPRAPLRQGLPGRVWADLTRPADSLLPGQVPAQDARCPAVGNRVMSAPVSAMIMPATPVLIPRIVTIISRIT